jgi:hypothetical protein
LDNKDVDNDIEDGVDGVEVYASSFGEVFSLPFPIAQGIQPSTF